MLIPIGALKKRGDFETAYRQGKPLFCGIMGMRVSFGKSESVRFGISVGLKFSKKAVDRNRLKRQIRTVFLENKPKFSRSFDGVIFVNARKCQGKTRFGMEEIRSSLEGCFRAASLTR